MLIVLIGVGALLAVYRKYRLLKEQKEVAEEILELKKKDKFRKRKRRYVKDKVVGARLSNLDASGLDYMLDVDDEGNVRKESSVEVRYGLLRAGDLE